MSIHKNDSANWITFGLSRQAGNCQGGTESFSEAVLRILEAQGTRGFSGIVERAYAFKRETGQDMLAIHRDVVDSIMEDAEGHYERDHDEDIECLHNCAEDCATCANHVRHDCMVRSEQWNFLLNRTSVNWACGHQCNDEDSHDDCVMNDCTCGYPDGVLESCDCDLTRECNHDCESSCDTCSLHNDEDMHDCTVHSRMGSSCGHDCESDGCVEAHHENNPRDESSDHLATMNGYADEWNRAKSHADMVAKYHRKFLTEEQSEYLQANFRFVDTWTDPITRANSIMHLDGHERETMSRSPFSRLASNDADFIRVTDLQSLRHGLACAETTERVRAISFLIMGNLSGVLNAEVPQVTYGMRTMLKFLNTNGTCEDRNLIGAELIKSNPHADKVAHVLSLIHRDNRIMNMSMLLETIVWNEDMVSRLSGNASLAGVLSVIKREIGASHDYSVSHRILNGLRRLRNPRAPILYPYHFMAMHLAEVYTRERDVVTGLETYCDIPRAIASDTFRASLMTYLGLASDEDSCPSVFHEHGAQSI